MSSSNTIIKVRNLGKKYRRRTIFDKADFDIAAGDCIGVVGANGCGKSTLLKILSGADAPSVGSLEYFGENPLQKRALFSRCIGYVPQENPLFENLTVLDNLRLWYCEADAGLTWEQDRFGLSPYRHYTVRKLSGGMKKRLSIACSVAKNPPVLILDEPGASLDIVCKADICAYLEQYRKNGGTIIITSHESGELALCNRMFLIDEARVREIAPVSGEKLMRLIRKTSSPDT